jgi:hypothetical protein
MELITELRDYGITGLRNYGITGLRDYGITETSHIMDLLAPGLGPGNRGYAMVAAASIRSLSMEKT